MTQETRIGLIVGLAFIVLFGVVLSELGTLDEAPQDRSDRVSGGFYARAPVTPRAQEQPRREALLLVARRRPEPRGARQPQRRQQPPRVTRTDQTPTRTPPPIAPQRPTRPAPTSPSRRGDGREMTPEEFAAIHGVGAGVGRVGNSRMYVTRSGDNLTAIARKFYRTPSRKAVMKIFNANRNVLQTPDALGVGIEIVIPN